MTQFKVGDRVREKDSGREGVVNRATQDTVWFTFPGYEWSFFSYPDRLELIEPVPTKSAPFYMLLVDGMDTIWSRHNTLEEARKAGNDLLVAGNSEKGVSVLRVIEYGKLPAREIEWRKIE